MTPYYTCCCHLLYYEYTNLAYIVLLCFIILFQYNYKCLHNYICSLNFLTKDDLKLLLGWITKYYCIFNHDLEMYQYILIPLHLLRSVIHCCMYLCLLRPRNDTDKKVRFVVQVYFFTRLKLISR